MRERVTFWLKIASLPVTAGLWYLVYLAYRREEGEDRSQTRYFESGEKASEFRVVTVRVPKRAVGAIIGKGGAVIKGLQDSTRARITFVNREESMEEEEVMIRGIAKNVDEAERQVKNIIATVPEQLTEETSLPSKFIGPLIGRQGENIRAVMTATGAKIDVERNSSVRQGSSALARTLTIRGTREQIDAVYQYLEELQNEIQEKDKRKVTLQNNFQTLPDREESIEVFVSVVMNPNTLFLQLTETCYALNPLVKQMTNHYSGRRPNLNFTYKEGHYVAAVFNDCWHRARVAEVTEEFVDVDYLDYGDAAQVPLSKVQPLSEPSFFKLPFQAIEVRLHGVEYEEKFHEEGTSVLEKISYQSEGVRLLAKVVSKSEDRPSVILFDPNRRDEERNLNEMMIRSGFCYRTANV